MEFTALPKALGLRSHAWSLFLGFFNFLEEPFERIPHLCQMDPAVVRKKLQILINKGYVGTRTDKHVVLYGLKPFSGIIRRLKGQDEQLDQEIAALGAVDTLKGCPSITIPALSEARDRSDFLPDVETYVNRLFPIIDLRMGTACNFNCLYCLVGHEKKILNNVRDIFSALRFARSQNIEKVSLTGGEPTLHPQLTAIISYAKNIGFREIILVTNGSLLTRGGRLKEYIDHGVTILNLSFDTPDKNISERLWRCGAYDTVVAAFDEIARFPQVPVGVITVVTKMNYTQLPQLVRFYATMKDRMKNLFIPTFDYVMPEENAWIYRDMIMPELSKVRPYLHKALALAKKLKVPLTYRGFPICHYPGYELYSLDRYMTIFKLVDRGTQVEFDRTSLSLRRMKGVHCSRCAYYRECTGLARGYAYTYGTKELRPGLYRRTV